MDLFLIFHFLWQVLLKNWDIGDEDDEGIVV